MSQFFADSDALTAPERAIAIRRYIYFDLGDHRALAPREVAESLVEFATSVRLIDELTAAPESDLTSEQRAKLTALADRLRSYAPQQEGTT